jgi:hypothetical protein
MGMGTPHKLLEPRLFSADAKEVCLNCGNPTRLMNRSPDAAYGRRYERQTFTRAICDFRTERIVDTEGKPPELLRY